MAQKVQVLLEDDLDGSEATETVAFSLDGTSYEIDLNDKNAKALRKIISPYAEKARKQSAPKTRRGRQAAPSSDVKSGDVRAWAKANGIDVNERGRIPAELVVKFKAANS